MSGKEEKDSVQRTGAENSGEEDDGEMDSIRKFFVEKLRIFSSSDAEGQSVEKVIEDLTFEGLINHWKQNPFKNVITLVGAGISTSAGIPDFRSPGSGLYDNLQKYNLPHPQAIFELDYFDENPQPFFALAKELYPGSFNPTPSHYFVRLLHEKGLLVRHYTQNIDTLERIAGIPVEKLVEAHGTFYTNHCRSCRKAYSMEWAKEKIFQDSVPTCEDCNGVVKPDIVFFGESLPRKFYELPCQDFPKCDLVIIMGTSLEVHPFASLVSRAPPRCLRLLINRTKVGNEPISAFSGPKMLFDSPNNTRDIAYLGNCDDGVWALVEGLGWTKELKDLIKRDRERLAKEQDNQKKEVKAEKAEDEKKSGTSKENSTPNGEKDKRKAHDAEASP